MRWISLTLIGALLLSLAAAPTSRAQTAVRPLLAWSPTADLIALTNADQVLLYSLSADLDAWELQTSFSGEGAVISALAWQPQGAALAAGDVEGRLFLWTLSDQTRQQAQAHSAPIRALAWQAEGAHIAAADRDWLSVWAVQPLALEQRWVGEGVITALVWHGDLIAVGGAQRATYEQGYLTLHDQRGALVERYSAEMRAPFSLQSLPDSQLGIGTPFDVFVWQPHTDAYTPLSLPFTEGESAGLAIWSPRGDRALVALGSRLLCLAEGVPNGEMALVLPVAAAAWRADGAYAALLADDGALSILAAATCTPQTTLRATP
jgi:hypothetical protein